MTTQPGMGMVMGMPGMQGMPVLPGSQPIVWMTKPQPIPGCPVGLEYLTSIDHLLVKQQIELLEGKLRLFVVCFFCFFPFFFLLQGVQNESLQFHHIITLTNSEPQ